MPDLTKKLIELHSPMLNEKCQTNQETDNKFDEKAHFKRLGLKQKIMSGQA